MLVYAGGDLNPLLRNEPFRAQFPEAAEPEQ